MQEDIQRTLERGSRLDTHTKIVLAYSRLVFRYLDDQLFERNLYCIQPGFAYLSRFLCSTYTYLR